MTDQALKAAVERVSEAIDEADHGTLVIVTKADLRTLLAALSSQASVMEEMAKGLEVARDEEHNRLFDAYVAGATNVHDYWTENPGEAPHGDPEFDEAANDYAASVIDAAHGYASKLVDAAPVPVPGGSDRNCWAAAAISGVTQLAAALREIQRVTGLTPQDVISQQRGIPHRALEAFAALNTLEAVSTDRSAEEAWAHHWEVVDLLLTDPNRRDAQRISRARQFLAALKPVSE